MRNNKINATSLLAFLYLVILSSCSISESEETIPTITKFEPQAGDYGALVTISGSNFTSTVESNTVEFNGIEAEVISASPNELVVEVPVGATSGPIMVRSNGEVTNSIENFEVTAGSWVRKAEPNIFVAESINFAIRGQVYVHKPQTTVDGELITASFWQYNPQSDRWAEKQVLDQNLNINLGSYWSTEDYGFFLDREKLWRYDPSANSWDMQTIELYNGDPFFTNFYIKSVNKAYFVHQTGKVVSYNHSTGAIEVEHRLPLDSDELLALFGFSIASENRALITNRGGKVYMFDPANETQTWSISSDFPGIYADRLNGGVAFTVGNNFYLGNSRSDVEQSLWHFNIDEMKWYRKADFPRVSSLTIAISTGERVYWGLGVDSNNFFITDFYEFTP